MRRMKKHLLAVLTTSLIAASFPAAAYAGTSTLTPGEATNIDVQAKHAGSVTDEPVYKVDITWGEMQFTYLEEGSRVWNPDTHEYETSVTSRWEERGNTVTVTNHSNAAISAELKFTPEAGSGVTGAFDYLRQVLPSAEGSTVAQAPNGTSILHLSGAMDASASEYKKVGTVTISLE